MVPGFLASSLIFRHGHRPAPTGKHVTVSTTPAPSPWKRANTDWLHEARWGMFVHYLADSASNLKPITLTADDWNRRIDAFDVDGLAKQLAYARVPYFCITLGQNSGFYLSPNSTYDAIVGIKPSKCSKRDLIADLATAFKPYGIRLMVYLPGGAPAADAVAKARLEEPVDERLSTIQKHWEAVCREWSLRWGKNVNGWWIDGPYNKEAYSHPDAPNYRSFASTPSSRSTTACACRSTRSRNATTSPRAKSSATCRWPPAACRIIRGCRISPATSTAHSCTC